MSRSLGEVLRDWASSLVRYPHYKVLSLGIAVVAWLYAQGEQVVETQVRAQIEWSLPEGLLPTEPLPTQLTLTVSGSRNATRKAAQQTLRVPIDLSSSEQQQHDVEFSSHTVEGIPATVEIKGYAPSAMRFMLDEVQAKKVRIRPVVVGDVADGYLISTTGVMPPVVMIRGPRVAIEGVGELETLPIEVSGISRDMEQRVELSLPRSVQLLTDKAIRVTVDVEPMNVTRSFTDVPVFLWDHAGWTVEPAVVDVTLDGPAAAMSALRADEVVVFAHLPDEPARNSYEVPFGPGEGVRMRVTQGGGAEVTVESVQPSVVVVSRP